MKNWLTLFVRFLTTSFSSIIKATAVTYLAVFLILPGCASVGKGQHTLVKAEDIYNARIHLNGAFSDLLVYPGLPDTFRMIALSKKAELNSLKYKEYMFNKYGDADFKAAKLDVSIRDRTTSPAFVPIDLSSLYLDKMAEMALKPDLKFEKKIALENFIKARLLNQPDMANVTVLHHRNKNQDDLGVYYYYPRVSVEFSSSLLSKSSLDRFSFLAIGLRLNTDKEKSKFGDMVRIINVSPKAANIEEYTRGQMTTANTLAANSNFGKTGSNTSANTQAEADGKTTNSAQDVTGSSFLADLSFTHSETYVNNLLDSIEARTVGIYDEGQVFLAELRSLKNKRIGGTYTFDLMLEIPSNLTPTKCGATNCSKEGLENTPITDHLTAEIFLIGVVRHVYKRGFTGNFTKVPEPENDFSFQQVVLGHETNVGVWRFNNESFTSLGPKRKETAHKISVITNHKDARYVIKDKNNTIIGKGKGADSTVSIKPTGKQIVLKVEFIDVVVIGEKGAVSVLSASPVTIVFPAIPKSQSVVGNYKS